MSWADYNEFIQRELIPDIIDGVIYRSLDPWFRVFGRAEAQGGDRITSRMRTAWTSNAAAYTKADVDPASATQTLVKPYWAKTFWHGAAEVHGIDLSNSATSQERSRVENMLGDATRMEVADMMDIIVAAFYTRLKADIDSSGTAYSDASLSRSTYAVLASYEEGTDTAITLALWRAMVAAVRLDNQVKLSDYIALVEEAVLGVLQPLAAALHTWNVTGVAGRAVDMGYQPLANFEGLDIADPYADFANMTTGDIFMLRKQDVQITPHRPLTLSPVPSGRDSIKIVPRIGINIHVDNPGLQGKMTSKD